MIQGDEQPFQNVRPRLRLPQLVLGAADDDFDAVLEEDEQQALER